jgi:hypothetical protein
MGRIKDWLMSMESLAEEAIANNFDKEKQDFEGSV